MWPVGKYWAQVYNKFSSSPIKKPLNFVNNFQQGKILRESR
jgi:hypothetical protein